MLKTLKDINLNGKTILYRSPYDIGVSEKNGKLILKDDSRIRATLPSLEYLLCENCKIAILTWVKRPEGVIDEKLRTIPHAKALSSLLNHPVEHINECVGTEVQKRVANLKPKEILMLENTRFHPEEFDDDDNFAKELTIGYDYIVFDGFPQAHRKHSSTTGILRHLPACTGLYFQKELDSLSKVLDNPDKPVTVIIGGAKISDKVDAINNLIDVADTFLLGGGPANVFFKAEGKSIGDSFIEDKFVDKAKKENKDWVEVANKLKEKASSNQIKIPIDLVIGRSINDDTEYQVVKTDSQDIIPEGWGAYDIGPETSKLYSQIIKNSKTILWAGPMGVFELPNYANGTKTIANAMSESNATTLVAGGDTIEAINKLGNPEKINHISYAGGATLQFLAGKEMPVIEGLKNQ